MTHNISKTNYTILNPYRVNVANIHLSLMLDCGYQQVTKSAEVYGYHFTIIKSATHTRATRP